MPSHRPRLLVVLLFPFALTAVLAADDDPTPHLARIKAVKTEGQGNDEAQAAWKQLVAIGPAALLPTLAAMPETDAIVNNWLRAAVDAIAEKALAAGKLPSKELEAFIKERRNAGPARRAAYEWLIKADTTAPDRLLPGMLDDPNGELRRDAVAVVIRKGDDLAKSQQAQAIQAYQTALTAARDADQVDALAAKLDKLGVKVDVAAHYGFIRDWKLLAQFDNRAGVGYQAVYPPEKEFDPEKTYKGKEGAATKWLDHRTSDPRGLIDLNKVLGKFKGAVAYGYAFIDSPKEQKIELRAGCITAIKIYLNGKQVFGREEYHHGMAQDQHVAFGTLKPGRNEILVKICQNEQTEAWAQDWKFQLRLCDALGGAVPFKTITLSAEKKEGQR